VRAVLALFTATRRRRCTPPARRLLVQWIAPTNRPSPAGLPFQAFTPNVDVGIRRSYVDLIRGPIQFARRGDALRARRCKVRRNPGPCPIQCVSRDPRSDPRAIRSRRLVLNRHRGSRVLDPGGDKRSDLGCSAEGELMSVRSIPRPVPNPSPPPPQRPETPNEPGHQSKL
jgi:hypothetical protein